jgi:hypothetical protein
VKDGRIVAIGQRGIINAEGTISTCVRSAHLMPAECHVSGPECTWNLTFVRDVHGVLW